MGKTFFTLATAEQLVRAYASPGYLWAMTETDITQCEVLLSKVINYEGKSVALLVKENDGYGQTFITGSHFKHANWAWKTWDAMLTPLTI